jgi:hypothetical protein
MAVTANFPLSHDALALLKRSLHQRLPDIKSSHLAEAMAAALGFQTNAAAQARMREQSRVELSSFDSSVFSRRLLELGYRGVADVSEDVRLAQAVWMAGPDEGLAPRSPLERCASYGVRLLRKESGEVFAHHPVAGVLGPCADEHVAAQLACSAWGI